MSRNAGNDEFLDISRHFGKNKAITPGWALFSGVQF